jgi:hypothetical protein
MLVWCISKVGLPYCIVVENSCLIFLRLDLELNIKVTNNACIKLVYSLLFQ